MAPQYVDILNTLPATLCAIPRYFRLTSFWRVAIVPCQIRETTAVLPDPFPVFVNSQAPARVHRDIENQSRNVGAAGSAPQTAA